MDNFDNRPDPDSILESLHEKEDSKQGRLKIFFGYAAGVGKTYAMLDDAHEQLKCGVDVLVGYIEPHTRPETMQLLQGLPVLKPQTVLYRNIELKEFDLDEVLRRKPQLVLVDELAHTNAVGVRNRKRYQDIEELLNAGIDVYTTINVQHIESLNDVVEDITKIRVQETIPDYIFDRADNIKLIDIEPDELLHRFTEGKIYRPERAKTAMSNFFTHENLRLLREIAMRKATDRISFKNQNERKFSDKMANTKLLVCIGPSPSTAKCIRWTARAADAFHAPWTAVFVENMESECLTEEQQKSIRANMDLAVKLGADLVTLNGHDIAAVVAEYAKLSGITNIVIGKSRKMKTIKSLFEVDFEDKLISLLPNIEVHIIPGNVGRRPYRKPRKAEQKFNFCFSWQDTIKTISMLIATTLLSLALRVFDIGDQNMIMVYILCVLVISRATVGYAYGIIASVISVLTFNFFFTEPYFTFNAIQAGYPITFVIMLLVALITSALTVRVKTQAKLAVERERRTDVLYEINKKLLATRGLEKIVALANDYIVNLFGRSVVFYTADPEQGPAGNFAQAPEDEDASFLLTEDEKAVAHWVFINQKRAGAGTDTLMGAGAFYMPIIAQGRVLAVMGISCSKGILNHNNRLFLRMIGSQVAMALERQRLSDEQRSILVESEKEKMRSNLLRAISHDLRTPLTGILGASSAILENDDYLDKPTRNKLISNIKEDSQWLIRIVENLLSVTRINEGTMNVAKVPEAAEEIIAEAVTRIRSRFPQRRISVQVPDELLMVPVDGTLIAQVLINLLENAIKHSPNESLIEVYLKKNGAYAIFEVLDEGSGISKEDFPYLFESYMPNSTKSPDSSRGMGIGLSICMSIIKAHSGKMEAENRKEGGAIFQFTLPLEKSDEL
ncbi:two-component system sensor histidine kinase KdpD [Hydrogenoanaerobacterium saccharovorans]|uniref:histidine kinase n=1 Tax=Hydrogenoanaerobacterium saccharovorans TaxID=474960 RepID=A0A1H8BGE3_9FIRM|nr:sensor histidine kinase KdpD [Hydrogenoanaerobacterium saccharovorans]RPF47420.1 two-component system sensor histidine kinase KdpD [Hydrogenoanaerobacterium saccharovorans]SEM81893.1 two-component system, OmpR family, sensor histidine kinase KdpD [Hydrogenoanaerobacterium saccharovorans]